MQQMLSPTPLDAQNSVVGLDQFVAALRAPRSFARVRASIRVSSPHRIGTEGQGIGVARHYRPTSRSFAEEELPLGTVGTLVFACSDGDRLAEHFNLNGYHS
jgi:hypothetical protein